MKYVIALVIALTALASCGAPAWKQPGLPPDGYANRSPQEQLDAAVSIFVLCSNGMGMGSGVMVSPTHVLTANHVVDCSGGSLIAMSVTVYGDRHLEATIDVTMPEADIARLKLLGVAHYTSVNVGRRPELDERVCFSSVIPTRDRHCGTVQNPYNQRDMNIKHDGLTQPGNSGSGMYNQHGELVGIVTRYVRCANGQICGGTAAGLWDDVWLALPSRDYGGKKENATARNSVTPSRVVESLVQTR